MTDMKVGALSGPFGSKHVGVTAKNVAARFESHPGSKRFYSEQPAACGRSDRPGNILFPLSNQVRDALKLASRQS